MEWTVSFEMAVCFAIQSARSGCALCIPVLLVAKWRRRQTQAEKKRTEDDTICVCWTMSFSFIAIIMELTYETFDNSLLLFQRWKTWPFHFKNTFAKETIHLTLSVFTCSPGCCFFLPQPYALWQCDKNKPLPNHWIVYLSLRLTDYARKNDSLFPLM